MDGVPRTMCTAVVATTALLLAGCGGAIQARGKVHASRLEALCAEAHQALRQIAYRDLHLKGTPRFNRAGFEAAGRDSAAALDVAVGRLNALAAAELASGATKNALGSLDEHRAQLRQFVSEVRHTDELQGKNSIYFIGWRYLFAERDLACEHRTPQAN
jgi:hypothetical protein